MNEPGETKRIVGEAALSLMAFAFGLFYSWRHGFVTKDLVWGLWLSSLVVGYAAILIGVPCDILFPNRDPKAEAERAALRGMLKQRGDPSTPILAQPKKPSRGPSPMNWFMLVFMLGFSTFHFCGFHAGHAQVLNHFFPLEPGVDPEFIKAFTSPLLLWKKAGEFVFADYAGFLLPALIAERGALLIAARPLLERYPRFDRWRIKKPRGTNASLAMPYRNVAKMHFTIMGLGLAAHYSLDTAAIFVVIYALYFFPWSLFRRNREETRVQSPPLEQQASGT